MTEPTAYHPSLAYSFTKSVSESSHALTLNDEICNYIEVVWGLYFSVVFCIFGNELERYGNFFYSMRLFGITAVWMTLRDNPTFVDANFVNDFMRIVFASTLSQFVAKATDAFEAESLLQTWTVVTIFTTFTINLVDPLLREHAGCEAGEPTVYFPQVGWDNCEDWKFAFAVTWAYAGLSWFVLALVLYVANKFEGRYEWILDLGSRASISTVCSSEAIYAGTSALRLYGTSVQELGYSGAMMSVGFYVLAVLGFITAQGIAMWVERTLDPEVNSWCLSKFFLRVILWLAQPLFLMETAFDKLEDYLVSVMSESDDEDFEAMMKFAWFKKKTVADLKLQDDISSSKTNTHPTMALGSFEVSDSQRVGSGCPLPVLSDEESGL